MFMVFNPQPAAKLAATGRLTSALDLVQADMPFPVDMGSVGPEILQGVVLARLGAEDVNHHVSVVLHHPGAVFILQNTGIISRLNAAVAAG
jgi:hypothetical protein